MVLENEYSLVKTFIRSVLSVSGLSPSQGLAFCKREWKRKIVKRRDKKKRGRERGIKPLFGEFLESVSGFALNEVSLVGGGVDGIQHFLREKMGF